MAWPLLLAYLITLQSCLTCAEPASTTSTLHILHAISPDDNIINIVSNDASRLQYLTSLATATARVPIASGLHRISSPIYVVRARFGTPPQHLLVALDISSDTAWIPCSGCIGCPLSSTAAFATAASTSYRPLPCGSESCSQVPNPSCSVTVCSFNLTYGSSSLAADLVQDSVALSADVVSGFNFGCLRTVTGTSVLQQGLLGLARGPLSFLSQSTSLYSATFSYCLPNFRTSNFSGTLRLGTIQPPVVKTTALLYNPHRSSLYYVSLTGIRVGRRLVPIPPSALAFNTDTGAGTIIDTGTMFTRLVAPAYVAVRNEFRRRVKGVVSSLGGFDTCYTGPVVVPAITLEFTGMNVTLPAGNVMIHSTAGAVSCLAMAAAPENVNSVLNVIASMQQQNLRVLIDVPNSRVGFAREVCSVAAAT